MWYLGASVPPAAHLSPGPQIIPEELVYPPRPVPPLVGEVRAARLQPLVVAPPRGFPASLNPLECWGQQLLPGFRSTTSLYRPTPATTVKAPSGSDMPQLTINIFSSANHEPYTYHLSQTSFIKCPSSGRLDHGGREVNSGPVPGT